MFAGIMLAITINIIVDIILAITMIMREGGGGNKLQLVSWFSQGGGRILIFYSLLILSLNKKISIIVISIIIFIPIFSI